LKTRETLESSELNQHVLHSMQKTSNALKAMGLDKDKQEDYRVKERNAPIAYSMERIVSALVSLAILFTIERCTEFSKR